MPYLEETYGAAALVILGVALSLSVTFIILKVLSRIRRLRSTRRHLALEAAYGSDRFLPLARTYPGEARSLIVQRVGRGDELAEQYFMDLDLAREYQHRLDRGNERVRAQVALDVAEIPPHLGTLDLVIPLLLDRHPIVREAAMRAVSQHADASIAYTALLAMERYHDQKFHRLARHTLANCGPEVTPVVVGGLASPNRSVRYLCLDVLSDLGDERALPFLLEREGDPDKEVRIRVSRALRHYDRKDAAQALLRLSADSEWEVRAQAARSLGGCSYRLALPRLMELACDESFWVRRNAAEALGGRGREGTAALLELAEGNDDYAADAAKEVLERRQSTEEEAVS